MFVVYKCFPSYHKWRTFACKASVYQSQSTSLGETGRTLKPCARQPRTHAGSSTRLGQSLLASSASPRGGSHTASSGTHSS